MVNIKGVHGEQSREDLSGNPNPPAKLRTKPPRHQMVKC